MEQRIATESADQVPRESRVRVRRRLSSVGRALLSEQEIGAGMSAWYLLYDTPFDSSHPSIEIYMKEIILCLDGGRLNARVVRSGDSIGFATSYQNYVQRNNCLEEQHMHKLIRERDFKRLSAATRTNFDAHVLRP